MPNDYLGTYAGGTAVMRGSGGLREPLWTEIQAV